MSIRRIRLALKEGRYEYSIHDLEEMDEDQLADSDVYEATMKGKVVAKLTGDPRGTRFVVFADSRWTKRLGLRSFAGFSRQTYCV